MILFQLRNQESVHLPRKALDAITLAERTVIALAPTSAATMAALTSAATPTPLPNQIQRSRFVFDLISKQPEHHPQNSHQLTKPQVSCRRLLFQQQSVKWNFICHILGYEAPQIQLPEPVVRVFEGSECTLKCVTRGFPQPTITWFKKQVVSIFFFILRSSLIKKNLNGILKKWSYVWF